LHLDGSPHVIRHNDHSMALRCRERAPSTTSQAAIHWLTAILLLRFPADIR
jgi:hypothetical protein